MKKKKLINKTKNNEDIRFSLGTLVLLLFCTFILVVSTFVSLDVFYPVIPSAQDGVNGLKWEDFFETFSIIPQVPAVIFIGALLGRKFATVSIVFYILLGLFLLPVFALFCARGRNFLCCAVWFRVYSGIYSGGLDFGIYNKRRSEP